MDMNWVERGFAAIAVAGFLALVSAVAVLMLQ
jgi:hypothetical protein